MVKRQIAPTARKARSRAAARGTRFRIVGIFRASTRAFNCGEGTGVARLKKSIVFARIDSTPLSERHSDDPFNRLPFVDPSPLRPPAATTARTGVEPQTAQVAASLVSSRDGNERCTRSRIRHFQIGQRRGHRPVAETFIARKPAAPWHAISIGHVDAQFLSEPGGQEFAENASARAGKCERKIARSVWPAAVVALLT